jgi:hypothetical protein
MNLTPLLSIALILTARWLGYSRTDYPAATAVAETCNPAENLALSGQTLHGTTSSNSDS